MKNKLVNRKVKALICSGFLAGIAGCVSPEVQAEKDLSRVADPAARADIISNAALQDAVHDTSVWGEFSPMPARYVYSHPVDAILIKYDAEKASRSAIIQSVASFCQRHGFGGVTRVIDSQQVAITRERKTKVVPAVQIECAGFSA